MTETEKRFAFDLEGTLVDLELLHQQAFEHVAGSLGVRFNYDDFLKFIGAGELVISKAIADLIGGETIGHQEIRRAKQKIYNDLLHSQEIKPREGVIEYLDSAHSHFGDLVVVTLTPRDKAQLILSRSGLLSFFEYAVCEEDVTSLKPAPDAYSKAAGLLSSQTKRMLAHEDSPPGVASAKAAGSPVAAFPIFKNLTYDPEPDAIFMSWVGLDPKEIAEKLIRD